MNHEARSRDWRDRATRLRLLGDTPSADWCDEQADWHESNSPNTLRIKAAIARLEASRG